MQDARKNKVPAEEVNDIRDKINSADYAVGIKPC